MQTEMKTEAVDTLNPLRAGTFGNEGRKRRLDEPQAQGGEHPKRHKERSKGSEGDRGSGGSGGCGGRGTGSSFRLLASSAQAIKESLARNVDGTALNSSLKTVPNIGRQAEEGPSGGGGDGAESNGIQIQCEVVSEAYFLQVEEAVASAELQFEARSNRTADHTTDTIDEEQSSTINNNTSTFSSNSSFAASSSSSPAAAFAVSSAIPDIGDIEDCANPDALANAPPPSANFSSSSSSATSEVPLPPLVLRGGRLSVTDVASQAWCEVQVDMKLRLGRRAPSQEQAQAMAAGIAVHERMEQAAAEAAGRVLVEVEVQGREDRWAVYLLNCVSLLAELTRPNSQPEGRAGEGGERRLVRELPVFGPLSDSSGRVVWLMGIIDQVARAKRPAPPQAPQQAYQASSENSAPCPPAPRSSLPSYSSYACQPPSSSPSSSSPSSRTFLPPSPPSYDYFLSDTKTRRSPSLPGIAQKRGSRLQLLLYKRLFDQLTRCTPPMLQFPEAAFLAQLKVEGSFTAFSASVATHIAACGLAGASLLQLLRLALSHFALLEPCSNTLSVHYHLQQQQLSEGNVLSEQLPQQQSNGQLNGPLPQQQKQQQQLDAHSPPAPALLVPSAEQAAGAAPTSLPSSAQTPPQQTLASNISQLQAVQANTAVQPPGAAEANTEQELECLGSDVFQFDPLWLQTDLDHFIAYWLGERPPWPALIADKWKCKYCPYLVECTVSPLKQSKDWQAMQAVQAEAAEAGGGQTSQGMTASHV